MDRSNSALYNGAKSDISYNDTPNPKLLSSSLPNETTDPSNLIRVSAPFEMSDLRQSANQNNATSSLFNSSKVSCNGNSAPFQALPATPAFHIDSSSQTLPLSISAMSSAPEGWTWKLVTPEPGVGLTDVPSSKNSFGPWEPNDGHIAIGSKVKAPAERQKPKVDHFLGGHTQQIWQRHMTDWK